MNAKSPTIHAISKAIKSIVTITKLQLEFIIIITNKFNSVYYQIDILE